jgi:hypothetical protein
VAGGRSAIIGKIRPLAARLDRLSGWIMTVAGSFIVWYWATVLVSGSSTLGQTGIEQTIDSWSSAITRLVGERPLVVAATVGTLVLVRSGVRSRRDSSQRADAETSD